VKAKYIYETLGFTEDGDPIRDMEIGHDAQIQKLNNKFDWDWNPEEYGYPCKEKIIDITEYRGFHVKVSLIIPTFVDKGPSDNFYIGIPDIGEPYTDGPYEFDSPEKALESATKWLDNYLDD